MAPMTITDSDISGVIKRVYSGYREKIFPIATPLLANVKKGSAGGPRNMRWGGDNVYFDVVLSRPNGFVASPGGYFPPHAQSTEKQGSLPIKRFYATREIDGLAIVGTQSREHAFVSLAKKIVEEITDASTLGMQENLHGTGTGIKALITTVNSTTEIEVESPYGISGAGQGGLLLDVGDYIAVLDTGTGNAVLGRATITAVSNSGNTATLTLDTVIASMAATDKVVGATATDTAFNSHTNGLANITNRGGSYGNLHGIDQATYARWDAVRMVAGTDTPDVDQPGESDIWDLIVKVKGLSGKDAKAKPSEFLLLTTPGLEKKLAESYYGQRRFTPNEMMEIKGGFKAVAICGVPMISDIWCPKGTVYLVHLPSLTWVDSKDWGEITYGDSTKWERIAGRDAFRLAMGTYWNFGTLNRACHGSITGYTDAGNYGFVV
jgi:hypothetical protein